MAIQVGATPLIIPPSQSAKSTGAQPDANSADANIVISKVTKVNADGSVTTITTYADGHTETQTTPASGAQSAASGAQASASRSTTSARGNNFDLTV